MEHEARRVIADERANDDALDAVGDVDVMDDRRRVATLDAGEKRSAGVARIARAQHDVARALGDDDPELPRRSHLAHDASKRHDRRATREAHVERHVTRRVRRGGRAGPLAGRPCQRDQSDQPPQGAGPGRNRPTRCQTLAGPGVVHGAPLFYLEYLEKKARR